MKDAPAPVCLLRYALAGLLVASTVACDQATKRLAAEHLRDTAPRHLVGGTVQLLYTENPGAFLGLGARLPAAARFWVFTAGVPLALLAAMVLLLRASSYGGRDLAALSLLAGGGLGNVLDRVLNGGNVIDFLRIGVSALRTGVFNLADVAVVSGALLLIWTSFASRPVESANPPSPPSP